MTLYSDIALNADSVYLNEAGTLSISSLIELSGLTQLELDGLIDIGVITPIMPSIAAAPYFQLRYIVTTQMARRLIDDFELDLNGMLLAMTLIEKIKLLEQQLGTAPIKRSAPAQLEMDLAC